VVVPESEVVVSLVVDVVGSEVVVSSVVDVVGSEVVVSVVASLAEVTSLAPLSLAPLSPVVVAESVVEPWVLDPCDAEVMLVRLSVAESEALGSSPVHPGRAVARARAPAKERGPRASVAEIDRRISAPQ
jgi:hypothetical protein